MVHRSRKLLLAAIVLGAGLCMAWPFRKSPPPMASENSSQEIPHSDVPGSPSRSTRDGREFDLRGTDPMANKTPQGNHPTGPPPLMAPSDSAFPGSHATAASRTDRNRNPDRLGQIHQVAGPITTPVAPIGASTRTDRRKQPVQPLQENHRPRPVYAGASLSREGDLMEAWPGESIHEIQDGDTLDKLAKRYLGDSGRALEIFELNRDKLKNPHLPLRIGEELRIPMTGQRSID